MKCIILSEEQHTEDLIRKIQTVLYILAHSIILVILCAILMQPVTTCTVDPEPTRTFYDIIRV